MYLNFRQLKADGRFLGLKSSILVRSSLEFSHNCGTKSVKVLGELGRVLRICSRFKGHSGSSRGFPVNSNIFPNWLLSLMPGNRALRANISAIIQAALEKGNFEISLTFMMILERFKENKTHLHTSTAEL